MIFLPTRQKYETHSALLKWRGRVCLKGLKVTHITTLHSIFSIWISDISFRTFFARFCSCSLETLLIWKSISLCITSDEIECLNMSCYAYVETEFWKYEFILSLTFRQHFTVNKICKKKTIYSTIYIIFFHFQSFCTDWALVMMSSQSQIKTHVKRGELFRNRTPNLLQKQTLIQHRFKKTLFL